MTPPMELREIAVDLGGRRVLNEVTLSAAPGRILGILGPNGGGKTTLLRAALGIVSLGAGSAMLAGQPVARLSERERAALAAYLPQDRRLAWNLPVWKVAALGRPFAPAGRAREIALDALNEVGMADRADRGVLDISGGERARVLMARLIASRAPLVVADEPAAGLDPDAQFQVMEVLGARAARGAAVVVTLHDLTLATRYCHTVAVLCEGRLLTAGQPAKVLTPAVLRAGFGVEGGVTETSFGSVLAARRLAQRPAGADDSGAASGAAKATPRGDDA